MIQHGAKSDVKICLFLKWVLLLSLLICFAGCVWVPLQPPTFEQGPIHVSVVHEVKEGETLEDIAQEYGSTPGAIAAVNRLPSLDTPAVGTELRIPRISMSFPALREVIHRPSLEFLKRSQLFRTQDSEGPDQSNNF